MGAVIEFKRPEPSKPTSYAADLRYVSLSKFDEVTRHMADTGTSKEDILEFFDRWRVHWGLEPMQRPESRHEN